MVKNKNRDEFSPATKRAIERQGHGHCSNPMCRRLTSGATSDAKGEIRIGEAAHICAAARGGPRYNENMTSEERSSADNGIWLCEVCARAVDSKDSIFTVQQLHEWKRRTNEDSWRSVVHNVPFGPGMQPPTPDELRDRLRAAAAADLAIFRRSSKWPGTTVALTLKIEFLGEPLTTRALANAVSTFDDLILVAAPGMGKTTTIFQIAEAVVDTGKGTPLIVPLGDWSTSTDGLLASILKRPAFEGISEADFRSVAAKPGVVLLLDGWNELDAGSRERARVQIANLKAELPELGLVISTRKQALDIPFGGTRVDLLPLGDEQQMAIARAMRGKDGERLVDQAWRTEGLRDLVTIPLYLTALLSLREGVPFPKTKEEVLRRFVEAQEQESGHASALQAVTGGFQRDYLDGLAVFATSTANTSVSDVNARKSVSETTRLLVEDGQLSFVISQPDVLLNGLVSNHVLVHSGDAPGYSFQHQLFQEWYASHQVERAMLQAVSDPMVRERLKFDMLDQRPWTEAVLFAVERVARGDAAQQAACSEAILAAFEIDPILAADMIFRVTDGVWTQIAANIRDFAHRWHAPGKLDRAVRFMITSGRPEFLDLLWPLLTHQDSQIHLGALRAAGTFRPSVLGNDAADGIAALSPEVRKNVLHEIAMNSGMDGLDLATAVAKKDNDPEVKALVLDALWFRRADRHVVDLMGDADDATYDIVVSRGHIGDVADDAIRARLEAARAKRRAAGETAADRLGVLLYAQDHGDVAAEMTKLIADMDIDGNDRSLLHLLYEIRQHFPRALADGLIRRLREGRGLFYGADDIWQPRLSL